MIYFFTTLLIFLIGCGYTTGGILYSTNHIYITPVVNKINIAAQTRTDMDYTLYPVLLEKKLTTVLFNKFNTDGHLMVSSSKEGALNLICEITDYKTQTLRYTEEETVEEQRLFLYVTIRLYNPQGKLLKKQRIVGESTYFLTGPLRKSETAAQEDLVVDTARRILEAVIEEW